jgi:predicted DNA binding CopG/RHH family protein
MEKKTVMGHNPLDGNHLEGATFDFIPYTESGSAQKESVSKKKTKPKKVVSYYLEEELIDEIRQKATKKELSFSNFVGKLLKKALSD